LLDDFFDKVESYSDINSYFTSSLLDKDKNSLIQKYSQGHYQLLLDMIKDYEFIDYGYNDVNINEDDIRNFREDIIKVIEENISDEDMALLYNKVDCVINSSREEGFGMFPFEGLACGTPCLITEGTGSEEYLKLLNGGFDRIKVEGKVFPEKRYPYVQEKEVSMWKEPSYKDLKDKIYKFLELKDEYKKEALEASKIIHENFNHEVIGKLFKKYFDKYGN
ncbi:MAG: glycosyltransferase, partial [Candidatus Woesearchaeota archaeon]